LLPNKASRKKKYLARYISRPFCPTTLRYNNMPAESYVVLSARQKEIAGRPFSKLLRGNRSGRPCATQTHGRTLPQGLCETRMATQRPPSKVKRSSLWWQLFPPHRQMSQSIFQRLATLRGPQMTILSERFGDHLRGERRVQTSYVEVGPAASRRSY
jgi:hypothetical protein